MVFDFKNDKSKRNHIDEITENIFIFVTEGAIKLNTTPEFETIKNNSNPSVSFEDGRNALILANAAYESYNSGKVIDISYD